MRCLYEAADWWQWLPSCMLQFSINVFIMVMPPVEYLR